MGSEGLLIADISTLQITSVIELCLMEYPANIGSLLVWCWASVADGVQLYTSSRSAYRVSCDGTPYSVNTKHLYKIYTMPDQRWRRWADIARCYTNILCLLGDYLEICLFRACGIMLVFQRMIQEELCSWQLEKSELHILVKALVKNLPIRCLRQWSQVVCSQLIYSDNY